MTHKRLPIVSYIASATIVAGCHKEAPSQSYVADHSAILGDDCGPTLEAPVEADQYVPGSYAGRRFLTPINHLGEDIQLAEGTPVGAMGDGHIVAYRAAAGYGELLVVIEHDLGEEIALPNGLGGLVGTQYVLTIYGHLRKSERRGGTQLTWQVGQEVQAGEVIGYVNDDAHNGDGAEHLHLGLRLMSATAAQAADPVAWFRGYDTARGIWRSHFAAAETVMRTLDSLADGCLAMCLEEEPPVPALPESELDPPPADGWLEVTWTTPGGAPLYRSTLSGRVITADGTWGEWRTWNEAWRSSSVSALMHLYACESFAFSVEYEHGDTLSWSCLGDGILQGTTTATWNGLTLATTIVRSGGGCGLQVQAPCSGVPQQTTAAPASEPPPAPAADPPPPASDPPPPTPSGGSSSGSSNTIGCELLAGSLAITVRGALNGTTLHDGGLSSIGFISVGSDITGWSTSTTPPAYFTVWNGPSYPHTVTVPASVRRFNLWVGGPSGTRWFNLYNWTASGAGCAIVPDGFGGLIIAR